MSDTPDNNEQNNEPVEEKISRFASAVKKIPFIDQIIPAKALHDKSFITNAAALSVVMVGYISPVSSEAFKSVGFFALSGSITNWLAVHMIFEKVPLVYGSGVVPSRFGEFRDGIKKMILQQFFNQENIDKFFAENHTPNIELTGVLEDKDFDNAYSKLVDAIKKSHLGMMLDMVGGEEVLYPLKAPVKEKLKNILQEISEDASKQKNMKKMIASKITEQVEPIIDKRLEELTPEMVKQIVQEMIHQHLGWLVVWGGVFGGIMGFVINLING